MKIVHWLAGVAALAPVAGTAAPNQTIEEGTVIWKDHRCAFFIVQTPSGYTLFEWMSGPRPSDGDKIEGPLEGFGPRNVVNKTAQDQVTLAYTEVHSTSKKWVGNKIPRFCRRRKDFLAELEREAAGQPAQVVPQQVPEPGAPAAPPEPEQSVQPPTQQ
jgi:hypothetical protein